MLFYGIKQKEFQRNYSKDKCIKLIRRIRVYHKKYFAIYCEKKIVLYRLGQYTAS